MKAAAHIVAFAVVLAGCGLEPASDTSADRQQSSAQQILDREVTEPGPFVGTYSVTLESTLRLEAVGSPLHRLADAAVLRCFFSVGCTDAIGRIAKVESAAELLDPHCDEWYADHAGNRTTVVCRQVDRTATVAVDAGEAYIELETEDGKVTETTAPLPAVGEPLVINDLVEELGGPVDVYFNSRGFIGAREATSDSSLVADVLDALSEADLDLDVLLDFTIRGARDGAAPPEINHVLEYF
jgi:hypothetical protein